MIKKIKKSIFYIMAFFLLALLLVGCEDKEGMALEVNGSPISIEDFEREFNIYKGEYIEQYGEDILKRETEDGILQEDILKKEVLEKLVQEELILQEASRQGIELTDEELEETLGYYIENLGGQESYLAFLDKKNLTEAEVRSSMRAQGLMDKYKSDMLEKMTIGEEEAREFFEDNRDSLIRVRARHILTLTEEEARDILKKLSTGEDFESLAIEYSKDILSAGKGGDLGYFTKTDFLIKELVDAAFELNVGEISDIVQTEIGYHIIKLEDRKDDFKSLKEDAILVLKEQKYSKHIEDMESKAKVRVYIEDIPKLKYEDNGASFLEKLFN